MGNNVGNSKMKIIRNMATEENRIFWKKAKEAAAIVRSWPDWKRAGINVSQLRSVPRIIK
jgi:hypothetical protein